MGDLRSKSAIVIGCGQTEDLKDKSNQLRHTYMQIMSQDEYDSLDSYSARINTKIFAHPRNGQTPQHGDSGA